MSPKTSTCSADASTSPEAVAEVRGKLVWVARLDRDGRDRAGLARALPVIALLVGFWLFVRCAAP